MIDPIPRKSLAQIIAGRLAASIVNKSLEVGSQLPSEREMIQPVRRQPLDITRGA